MNLLQKVASGAYMGLSERYDAILSRNWNWNFM